MLKLILNDNTEMELADGGFMSQFVILFNNRTAFNAAWGKMTAENLSNVEIQSDGQTVQRLQNIVLDGVQAVYNSDNTITGHFYFHGADPVGTKTQEDEEYIQAAKILLGEEV